MDREHEKCITPFDEFVTPSMLYFLKLLLPHLDISAQRILGVYIKFMELRCTILFFHGFKQVPSESILEDLKDFLDPEIQEQMAQMESMMSMMEMMQAMQTAAADDDPTDPADITKGVFEDGNYEQMAESSGTEESGSD